MEFPLMMYELTRGARRKVTYAMHLVPAGFCTVVMFFAWATLGVVGASSDELADFSGEFLLWATVTFQMGTVFLFTPMLTAGAIAREMQERTLGLLLMANARGVDVLFAKGLSAFTQSELLVLSCLPLQAMAALFGGVDVTGLFFVLTYVTLLNIAMTGVGLFCSSLAGRPVDAFILTVGFAMIWTMAGMMVDAVMAFSGSYLAMVSLNPLTPVTDAAAGRYLIDWLPIALAAGALGILSATGALPLIRRGAVEGAAASLHRPVYRGWRRGKPGRIPVLDWEVPVPKRLAIGPIDRLYAAGIGMRGGVYLRLPWSVFTVALSVIAALAVSFLIPIFVIYDVTISLAAARRDGSLELLYVTAESDEALAATVFKTHFRRALIFFPAVLVANAWENVIQWVISYELYAWFNFAASAAGVVAVSVIQIGFYVALGSYAATWRRTAAMQTFLAYLLYIGCGITLSCISGLLLAPTFFLVNAASNTTPSPLYSLVTAALEGVFLVLVAVACYQMFRTELSMRWRTGLAPLAAGQ
jgi:hypothetical protein